MHLINLFLSQRWLKGRYGQGINVMMTFHVQSNFLLKVQRVPKKMSFSGKTAITTFKLIQNAKVGGVLENSEYLLQCGHHAITTALHLPNQSVC